MNPKHKSFFNEFRSLCKKYDVDFIETTGLDEIDIKFHQEEGKSQEYYYFTYDVDGVSPLWIERVVRTAIKEGEE